LAQKLHSETYIRDRRCRGLLPRRAASRIEQFALQLQ